MWRAALALAVCFAASTASADKTVGVGTTSSAGGGDSSVVAVGVGGVGEALSTTGLEDVQTAFRMAVEVGDYKTANELVELAAEMAEARNTKLRRLVVWAFGWLPVVGPWI